MSSYRMIDTPNIGIIENTQQFTSSVVQDWNSE
jgi:hypothetical protein